MKYLFLIMLTLGITSCCSNKKTITKAVNKEAIDLKTSTDLTLNAELDSTKTETLKIIIPSKQPTVIKTVEMVEIKPEFNHNTWNALLQKSVTKLGNVNYKKIRANKHELQIYINSLSKNTPTKIWSKNKKLAYWINAYNALTIDLILRHYPLKSIKDIKQPWDQRLWKLGTKWYTLNDIEHGILRKMNEPRIHFAIVCASYSCPKLLNKAFSISNLETELTQVTQHFLSDTNRNNISKNNIEISKIFKWFSKDFKTQGTVIDFINLYSEIKVSRNAKIKYKDYNWKLNN